MKENLFKIVAWSSSGIKKSGYTLALSWIVQGSWKVINVILFSILLIQFTISL